MTSALILKVRVGASLGCFVTYYIGLLRIISGAAPTDLLAANMTAGLLDPHTITCVQASVGLYRVSHGALGANRLRHLGLRTSLCLLSIGCHTMIIYNYFSFLIQHVNQALSGALMHVNVKYVRKDSTVKRPQRKAAPVVRGSSLRRT